MAQLSNFRVVVNLSNFFNDHRHRARIFVNDSIKTVQDLQDKISSVFQINNFFLSTHNEYLPPSEDIRILQGDEILWVTPVVFGEHTLKQSQSEIPNSSKKCKTKRKATFKTDELSSEELWIPKKRKKSEEVVEKVLEHINVSNKKKKRKENHDKQLDGAFSTSDKNKKQREIQPPHVSNKINENNTLDVEGNDELNTDTQRKSKKKKKHHKLNEDIEMAVIEDARSNEPNTPKQIANEHVIEDIDESFRKNKLLYTKNSPLPTITAQYLKEKRINIVKIDYVVGKPPSIDEKESNVLVEGEETENQYCEELLEPITKHTGEQNGIAIPPETVPTNKTYPNKNDRITDGDNNQNKLQEKETVGEEQIVNNYPEIDKQIEPLPGNEDNIIDLENTEKIETINSHGEISPVQSIGNDQKKKDSNSRTEDDRKPKYFFFNSPSLKDIIRPAPMSKKEAPVTFDENGKQIFVPRFFKHPLSYIDPKSLEKLGSEDSNEKMEIVQSTSKNQENVPVETIACPKNITETNSQIFTLSIQSELNKSVLEESNGFSGIWLNETIELSKDEGDEHNSLGISGVHRITPDLHSSRFSRSRSTHQISGLGSMLKELRKADSSKTSSIDSNLDSDCSDFVTKRRRKRVRKSKKSRETQENVFVQPPILPPPKPMNVKGAPSIHIKFDEDGEIDKSGSKKSDVHVVDDEEVETNLQDILKAPSMSSMKPRVGDIIAFKILKIGSCYQPELSSHITGRVTEYHIENNQIALEIIGGLDQCKEPDGKFSMVLDGDENANFESRHREYNWADLLEPRLLFP